MTLTSKIIVRGYRESNLVAKGVDPDATQIEEALELLDTIVLASYGYEVGKLFVDWPIGEEGLNDQDRAWWVQNVWSYPPANMRLIAASAAVQTVYFHPAPSDGARMAIIDPGARLSAAPLTLDGNGRTIQGAATQALSTNSAKKIWFYRADLGDWVLMSTLTGAEDEEFPFPPEFDDYFTTKLAMRLNPRYGRTLGPSTASTLVETLEKLRARYYQMESVSGDTGYARLTRGYGQSRYRGAYGDSGMAHRGSRVLRPPHYEG